MSSDPQLRTRTLEEAWCEWGNHWKPKAEVTLEDVDWYAYSGKYHICTGCSASLARRAKTHLFLRRREVKT